MGTGNITQFVLTSQAIPASPVTQGPVNPTIAGPDWLPGGTFGVEASHHRHPQRLHHQHSHAPGRQRRGNIVSPMWKRQQW